MNCDINATSILYPPSLRVHTALAFFRILVLFIGTLNAC